VAGADYGETRGSVVFSPGQVTREIAVQVLGDTLIEPDETFTVVLTNPIGATLTAGRADVAIRDDDGGAVVAVVLIAGSTPGAFGSHFRTALQLHNATDGFASGNLIIRPMGGGTPRNAAYSLRPYETRSLSSEIDLGGLVTIDVAPLTGELPEASVRVYNDAGTEGTAGFTTQLILLSEALRAGQRSALITPEDPSLMRYNIAVRSLGEGAVMELILRRAGGEIASRVTRSFAANELMQTAAGALFGIPLQGNDTITIVVTSGSAIVSGAGIDNVSQDPSITVARVLR
jgi:hypothetical protein